ncbi:unnamed protein product [Orchesella dallaii]|uniref:Ion transport domain-containing protein n=1 Tax=Orchesella dallaii TaxID=48710 RepID=A0ABP1RQI6_9HEXA
MQSYYVVSTPLFQRKGIVPFPLHKAAWEGNLEKLKHLLKEKDPRERDDCSKTPLHWACCFDEETTALKMVKAILANQKTPFQSTSGENEEKLVDYEDRYNQTPLHLATIKGHGLVIKELLSVGAKTNLRDDEKDDIMHEIYSKKPNILVPAYDHSVEVENEEKPEDSLSDSEKIGKERIGSQSWTIDFVTITGLPEPLDSKSFLGPETEWLSLCLRVSNEKKKDIFMHSVVRTFLYLKWKKIRILLWLSVLYHIAWLILYAYFNVDLYLAHCPFAVPDEGNDTESEVRTELDFTHNLSKSMDIKATGFITGVITYCDLWDHYTRLNSELWFLFMMTVTISLKEIYEIYLSTDKLYYFHQLENIGQWTVVVIVFLASIPVFRVDGNWGVGIYEWQYQASAFGVLLACSLTLSQIGKIPSLGIYILILGKVVRRFIMFIITFAAILMAFMISFQILMPEKIQFKDNPWGFVRILVMMTGEINYDDLFHTEEGDFQLPFPISTKFLFAAFIAIVTIILFNLLIGLTVSDIQGLQTRAELNSISIQVEEIHYMEKFLTSRALALFLRFIKKERWIQYFRVTSHTNNASSKVTVHEKDVPEELHNDLERLAKENMTRRNNELTNENVSTLHSVANQKVTMLKQQINEMLQDFLNESEQKKFSE